MTFEELLAHLDDLIALANHEGFVIFAGALSASREIMALRAGLYGYQGNVDSAVIAELRRLVADLSTRRADVDPV